MTEPAPVHEGRRLDWLAGWTRAAWSIRWPPGRTRDCPTVAGCGRAAGSWTRAGRAPAWARAAVAEAAAEPVPVPGLSMRNALAWYRNAQRRDQWPGEAYDGTSVLAGCLEGRARGCIRVPLGQARGAGAGGRGRGRTGHPGRGMAGRRLRHRRGRGAAAVGLRGGWALRLPDRRRGVPADLEAQDDAGRELRADLAELGCSPRCSGCWRRRTRPGSCRTAGGWRFGKNGLCVVPLSVLRGWAAAGWEAAQPQGRMLPTRKGTTVPTLGEAAAETEAAVPMVERDTDTTLHILAQDVQAGDRLLDPPDELGQESVTVRGRPQLVMDHRGRRVVVEQHGRGVHAARRAGGDGAPGGLTRPGESRRQG